MNVWKSNLPRHIKISFFSATMESGLLYGCECWTLSQALHKSLDGCYTRMLHVVLNIKQDEHITSKRLYWALPRTSVREDSSQKDHETSQSLPSTLGSPCQKA